MLLETITKIIAGFSFWEGLLALLSVVFAGWGLKERFAKGRLQKEVTTIKNEQINRLEEVAKETIRSNERVEQAVSARAASEHDSRNGGLRGDDGYRRPRS